MTPSPVPASTQQVCKACACAFPLPDARFCPYCGASLSEAAAPLPQDGKTERSVKRIAWMFLLCGVAAFFWLYTMEVGEFFARSGFPIKVLLSVLPSAACVIWALLCDKYGDDESPLLNPFMRRCLGWAWFFAVFVTVALLIVSCRIEDVRVTSLWFWFALAAAITVVGSCLLSFGPSLPLSMLYPVIGLIVSITPASVTDGGLDIVIAVVIQAAICLAVVKYGQRIARNEEERKTCDLIAALVLSAGMGFGVSLRIIPAIHLDAVNSNYYLASAIMAACAGVVFGIGWLRKSPIWKEGGLAALLMSAAWLVHIDMPGQAVFWSALAVSAGLALKKTVCRDLSLLRGLLISWAFLSVMFVLDSRIPISQSGIVPFISFTAAIVAGLRFRDNATAMAGLLSAAILVPLMARQMCDEVEPIVAIGLTIGYGYGLLKLVALIRKACRRKTH